MFDRYGMTLPEWDQWDAEGLKLLAPWFNQDGFLSALFTPHNEHRVVLTKLLNLGLTVANGHWDQRLEATCNALFPASIAVAFFLLARRHLTRRWLGAFGLFWVSFWRSRSRGKTSSAVFIHSNFSWLGSR